MAFDCQELTQLRFRPFTTKYFFLVFLLHVVAPSKV
jgi:hypothetical protein